MHYTAKLGKWKSKWHDVANNRAHVILLIVVGFVAAAYVAGASEDNSSWFFSIPNEEFERVMRGVYSQRGGTVPRRRRGAGPGDRRDAPPDALAHLSAQISARSRRSTPVI